MRGVNLEDKADTEEVEDMADMVADMVEVEDMVVADMEEVEDMADMADMVVADMADIDISVSICLVLLYTHIAVTASVAPIGHI